MRCRFRPLPMYEMNIKYSNEDSWEWFLFGCFSEKCIPRTWNDVWNEMLFCCCCRNGCIVNLCVYVLSVPHWNHLSFQILRNADLYVFFSFVVVYDCVFPFRIFLIQLFEVLTFLFTLTSNTPFRHLEVRLLMSTKHKEIRSFCELVFCERKKNESRRYFECPEVCANHQNDYFRVRHVVKLLC